MEDSILITILLVIVSILLVIDILIAVTVYKIVRHVKSVTEKADSAVSNIAEFSTVAKNMTVPLAFTKVIKTMVSRFGDSKDKNK